MEEKPVAVDVGGVTKYYGQGAERKKAVAGIDLKARLGEVTVLLGPNGSGKTTLLKLMAGLLSPDEGTVSVMGEDLAENPRAARRHVGWMPADERSGFYGRLSGRQNLEFFAALQRRNSDDLERVLGNLQILLGIGDEVNRRMLTVSSGERQKIGVARALLHDPAVLLLDEPFRNLDPHSTIRLRRLISHHLTRVKTKAVLVSTHQLDEARRIADVLLIIHRGTIVRAFEKRDLETELAGRTIEELYLSVIDKGDAA